MTSDGFGWPWISARRDRGYPRSPEGAGVQSEVIRAGQRRLVVGTPCNCPGRWVPNDSPRRGDFEVQQVQQNHKRPCLQEVPEFLKVQQKCNKVQQGAVQHGVQQWQRKRSIQYSMKISKLAYSCLRLRMLAGSGDRTASNK